MSAPDRAAAARGMREKTLTGYADPLSVAPGETVRFMVSCYAPGPYRVQIVRLVCGDARPSGAGFRELEIETPVTGELPGREQRIRPGSHAIVPERPALRDLASFTAHVFAFPTTPGRGRQGLLGTWSEPERSGFGLLLDDDGALALVLGDGRGRVRRATTGAPLEPRRWHRLAASYDAESGEVSLLQQPLPAGPGADATARHVAVTERLEPGLLGPGRGPLVLAGWLEGAGDEVGGHFNGKLDGPRLVRRAVAPGERDLLEERDVPRALAPEAVGWWDFSLDIGSERISDRSRNALHGRTVNLPTRAVTGRAWTGAEHCFARAPEQYAAMHFHDDDLSDAGWEPDFELRVPGELASGVYAARLRRDDSEDDHVVFFVRPPRGRATAEIAFLAPTASYLAYANQRLFLRAALFGGDGRPHNANDAMLLDHPEFGPSLYEHHSDGSGVHYSSHLRPIQDLKPRGGMWSFNADSNVIAWLEHTGRRYDVLTDGDLHREGLGLLERYRVIVTGVHPEYASTAMLDALEAYLQGGGRLMYLGGNGFYWRIAFHPERPGVIEVRRAEDGTRAWISEPGEYWHSFNGEYGGLWRRLGRPPNRLVGVGFAAQGFDGSSHYRRTAASRDPRAAFIFEGVEGDVIGDYGNIGGGAAGQEIDRYDRRLGSPRHALVLASSEAHRPGMLRTKEEFFATTERFDDPNVRADLVFFECPNGGAVFSTGSIAWAGSLAHDGYDNDVCRITTRVLERFADPEPFELPGDAG